MLRRGLGPLAAVLLAGVALAQTAPGGDAKKLRVLIIDGQNNHNWRATTPFMKKQLEDSGRFTVEVATAPERPPAPKKPQDATPEAPAKYQPELARFREAEAAYRLKMAQFRPDLTKVDVVLSNYNGDAWSKEFNADLEAALREGKVGLVIVHAANNAFGSWQEYNLMIGMGWRNPKG